LPGDRTRAAEDDTLRYALVVALFFALALNDPFVRALLASMGGLPLTDALCTVYYGAEMCNLKGRETVVVYGAGPVGLFATRSAWLMGAGRVIAVDHVDYRLEFARRWARVETLNSRTPTSSPRSRGSRTTAAPTAPSTRSDARPRAPPSSGRSACSGRCRPARRSRSGASTGRARPPYAAFDFGTAMNKQQSRWTTWSKMLGRAVPEPYALEPA
jgi:hypothetical protein